MQPGTWEFTRSGGMAANLIGRFCITAADIADPAVACQWLPFARREKQLQATGRSNGMASAQQYSGSCRLGGKIAAGQRPHRGRRGTYSDTQNVKKEGDTAASPILDIINGLRLGPGLRPLRKLTGFHPGDATWPTILFNTLQEFSPGSGKKGKFYSLPALEKAGIGKISRLPVSHPHRAGIGAAQLRRQEGHRRARARNWRPGSRTRRAPRKFPSSSRASCCRTSPACRCWSTWRPCAAWPRRWARIRRSSSRWCRWTWWSTTRCRSITTARRKRST